MAHHTDRKHAILILLLIISGGIGVVGADWWYMQVSLQAGGSGKSVTLPIPEALLPDPTPTPGTGLDQSQRVNLAVAAETPEPEPVSTPESSDPLIFYPDVTPTPSSRTVVCTDNTAVKKELEAAYVAKTQQEGEKHAQALHAGQDPAIENQRYQDMLNLLKRQFEVNMHAVPADCGYRQ